MKSFGSIALTAALLVAIFAAFYKLVTGATSDPLTNNYSYPNPLITTVIPTNTLIPFGVTPAGVPPPIQLPLPTPEPGKGHVTGRVLCNGLPKPFQYVHLIWIDGASYSILRVTPTDEAGRWFFGNLPPRTYGIAGETPRSLPTQLFVINADQITDWGDLDLGLLCS